MKVQLSPTRIVNDAVTVWNEPGPEVDVVMDLHNLTFREGSVDELYSFHVLDHLFPNEVAPAVSNWRKCLKKDCSLFIVVDDFEFIARLFIGGEMSIDEFNERHTHPAQFTKDNLLEAFIGAGFNKEGVVMYNGDVPDRFPKANYEIVMTSKKDD